MNSHPIDFARLELDKYLSLLGINADISLGLFEEFNIKTKVDDAYYDDAIAIYVKDKKGYVCGSNERSVLIGVYRLLEEWGVRWVRPGKNGTYIPKNLIACDVNIAEAASKRHRIICIEGATSIENVLDMVDWLPKVGFNGYYLQFNLPYVFFDRWYSHTDNPLKKPEGISEEQVLEYVKKTREEAKRRGLLLHAVGHGWTCAPFGIPDNGWYKLPPEKTPEEYRSICALVNGERRVWQDMPLASQLCYSNPRVKKTMANAVISYVKNNPEIDVVHFWLGDHFNNTCECAECTKDEYSDHYVRMINDVTDELHRLGLKQKIIFLVYYNSAFPPARERIHHPENTILMFAPISRTYSESFPNSFRITEIPPYRVNNFELGFGKATKVDDNLAYLHAWKKIYTGDAVDFDYHLMWDHLLDAGGEGVASILSQDLKNLGALGMNGYISCQLQRNFCPTSIAMTVMAKTLWNEKADFEQIKRDLYKATFGEEHLDELCNYFSILSRGFDVGAIRNTKVYNIDTFKKNMKAAIDAMNSIKTLINSQLNTSNEFQRDSWKYLSLHRELYLLLAKSILARARGDETSGKEYLEQAHMLNWSLEDELQPVLDSMFFRKVTASRIKINESPEFEGD